MKKWVSALLDLACVLVFVSAGIRSHGQTDALLPVAAPFIAALAMGWIVAIPLRAPESMASGLVIWLVTLVGGMLLRRVGGDGTAASFIMVAAGFLAVTMLGWRAIVLLVTRRRQPQP